MNKFSKILSFFFILLAVILIDSQNINAEIRVQYNLTSQPFKNKADSVQENFVAIIGEGKSVFKPVNRYVHDSLNIVGKQIETQNFFDIDSQLNIVVDSEEIVFSDLISTTYLGYKEDNKFNYQIIDEFKEIKGLRCQKAITKKYGRNWIAYFSKDYNFPFGPYKFNGLPGLIIELYDENNTFHYVMTSIKKYPKIYKYDASDKVIFVSESKYKETRRNVFLDPTFGGRFKFDEKTIRELLKENEEKLRNENLIELEDS